MGHHLDLTTWPRRHTFDFFLDYDQPFFNICAEVEVTETLKACRAQRRSFFLASWFACMGATNAVEPFRYRLRGDRVWVHDHIHLGATVLTQGDVFRFCYFEHTESFSAFEHQGGAAIEALKATPIDAPLQARDDTDDLIHGSVIPWLAFTGLAHAKRFVRGFSTPKITFGKHAPRGERFFMPVSVEAHHALMDAIHIARFFQSFEAALRAPSW